MSFLLLANHNIIILLKMEKQEKVHNIHFDTIFISNIFLKYIVLRKVLYQEILIYNSLIFVSR